MRMKRAAVCVLMSALLAGHAAAAAETPFDFFRPSGAEETTLTVMWRSEYSDPKTQDPFYRWAETSFESWEEKEGVTLELVPLAVPQGESVSQAWADYVKSIGGEEGNYPDLIVGDTAFLEQDAEAGALYDLSLDVSEYGEWSWYYEAVQDMASCGNGVYGVPFEAQTVCLWYNAEALAEAGVIGQDETGDRYEAWEPESRQEILEACQALRKADKEAECLNASDPLLYELLLRGLGGRLATGEGNWVVESDKIKNTLEFVRDLGQQGGTGGDLIVPALSEPEGMKDAGCAAMPSAREGSGKVSLAAGKLLEIPADSPDEETAWYFICHMMSRDNYAAYLSSAVKNGGLCVRRDALDLPEITENSEIALRQELLGSAGVLHETGRYGAAGECIREMLQAVLDDPTDAGIETAQEVYAESMRDAYGKDRCRPLVQEEEEEGEEDEEQKE